MKFSFITEDKKGPLFIKKLFKKKTDENIFAGTLVATTPSPISNKLGRLVKAAIPEVDRIIILADADGQDHKHVEDKILRHVDSGHRNLVHIVILDYEIEEWICYSNDFPMGGDKPSDVLKRLLPNGYKKRDLSRHAGKLECKKLQKCESFRRLLKALNVKV